MISERPEKPKLLYHYTDAVGLLGIVMSKTLYATDVRYLNDSQELELGLRILDTVVGERVELWRRDRPGSGVIGHFAGVLEQFRSSIRRRMRAFAVSFSTDGDLLSQWRAYAANGAGYAVGFAVEELERLHLCADPDEPSTAVDAKHQWTTTLRPCEYRSVEQYRALAGAVGYVLSRNEVNAVFSEESSGLFTTERLLEGVAGPADLEGEFMRHVADTLCTAKDPSFAEEREWRLLLKSSRLGFPEVEARPLHALQFRARGGVLVPYLKVWLGSPSIHRLGIQHIVVGPTAISAGKETASASLRDLLDAHDIQAEITPSAVPYRGR